MTSGGISFRPVNLRLPELVDNFESDKRSPLTATATPIVVRDISAKRSQIARKTGSGCPRTRANLRIHCTPVARTQRDAVVDPIRLCGRRCEQWVCHGPRSGTPKTKRSNGPTADDLFMSPAAQPPNSLRPRR